MTSSLSFLALGLVAGVLATWWWARRRTEQAVAILTDEVRRERIRQGFALVRSRLGGPGASRRAAEAILRIARTKTAFVN